MKQETMQRCEVEGARNRSTKRVSATLAAGLLAILALAAPRGLAAQARGAMPASQQEMMKKLVQMAPYRGYLKAHGDLQQPQPLLGGPVHVKITQSSGGVYVALPDHRKLDPNVFGTPKMPRAFAGTPAIDGLPPAARNTEGDHYTTAKPLTPFGDKFMTMGGASLDLQLTDATATDAAKSDDKVQLRASWKDKDGNTYEVRCCRMLATRGVEYPTFGGVVTNTLMHGSTRIGTGLMPTEYVYAAFWGMGEIRKNGEVLQQPRLIHGMLTEYVRKGGYALAEDAGVTPTTRHFHLIAPPFMPNMEQGRFDQSPVKTGFTLPNGQPLPFWHVMFENIDVSANRG